MTERWEAGGAETQATAHHRRWETHAASPTRQCDVTACLL